MDDDQQSRIDSPDLFVRIAENAMLMAEELREDYFQSTLGLAKTMRRTFRSGEGDFVISKAPREAMESVPVAFIDGGLSRIDLGIAVPLIARAGIFRVKPGERDLEKRETFKHFPVMLGDLKGGLKADNEYGTVVRHVVELAAMVAALEDPDFSDIRVLMLHGPLQFLSGPFFDHWFFRNDYRLLLGLAEDQPHVESLLERFDSFCGDCSIRDGERRCTHTAEDGHVPAVCMLAFLQQHIFERAQDKRVVVCGAIERSSGRALTKKVVRRILADSPQTFERLLEVLGMADRGVTVQAEAILDATRYNDANLLALALEPLEYLEWYPSTSLQRSSDERRVLFPKVLTTFARPSSSRYPLRLEAPADTDGAALTEIVTRALEYASLLPNYAFPVGLDIVDKYTAIPGWMSKAYRHLILSQYGQLLAGNYVDMTDVATLRSVLLLGGGGKRGRTQRPEA